MAIFVFRQQTWQELFCSGTRVVLIGFGENGSAVAFVLAQDSPSDPH